MKAAVFHEHGTSDVLRIEDISTPVPEAGGVLIRVHAAALNHLDIWTRRGVPMEITMPHIGGSDIAGVVEAVGDGVTGVKIGARVVVNPSLSCGSCEWCRAGEEPLCVNYRIIGEHTNGGFAEYVAVPATNLFLIPDDIEFEPAAAAPLAFLTAWRALASKARVRAGQSVLVTGASGGVATAAVQIAKHLGARVFALTTAEHVDRVKALGADVVYDREQVDFARQIWKDTDKRGVDVVIDSVGEAIWASCVRSLARGGRLIVYGATTGFRAELDLRVVFWKQIEVLGTTMANRSEFEEVMRLVFSGALRPVVDSVMPLSEIRAAHDRLERGQHFGKIVVVP
ncbi:MAG TPA: alcohol dehydrogenase catalytic domain-containing protein [Longimicrobiales bacterium]